MVYECRDCGNRLWEDDARILNVKGNARLVCPECEGLLSQMFGPVEDTVVSVLREHGPLDAESVSGRCEYSVEEVQNALRHLKERV